MVVPKITIEAIKQHIKIQSRGKTDAGAGDSDKAVPVGLNKETAEGILGSGYIALK